MLLLNSYSVIIPTGVAVKVKHVLSLTPGRMMVTEQDPVLPPVSTTVTEKLNQEPSLRLLKSFTYSKPIESSWKLR